MKKLNFALIIIGILCSLDIQANVWPDVTGIGDSIQPETGSGKFFVPADNKPITFEIRNPEKKFYEQVWFTITLGALIGFLSSFGLTAYNLSKANIKELKDARSELASIFSKLRTTANEIYHINFEFHYYYKQAFQERALMLDYKEADERAKGALILQREKKSAYDYLIADAMKHIQKFIYYMNDNQRSVTRELIVKVSEIKFDHFAYINDKKNPESNKPYNQFSNDKEGIDAALVNNNVIIGFISPMQGLLRETLKTYESGTHLKRLKDWVISLFN